MLQADVVGLVQELQKRRIELLWVGQPERVHDVPRRDSCTRVMSGCSARLMRTRWPFSQCLRGWNAAKLIRA